MNAKKVKVVLVAVLGLFLQSVAQSNQAGGEMRTINGDRVNLRSGPGTAYSIKWEYSTGFPLEVIKGKGPWVNVRDFENETGWIHRDFLINQPQMIVSANPNSDGKINIRAEPSQQSQIVGKAYYGVVFSTLEKKKGWVKVQHETGLSGWIQEKLLWGY